ncbi:MAG TPA: tetratricopeptide repeat protein [Gemmataceae bacterium]|nr:tetratricopeptide repeat protein [Gemmataceae bacterium]
MALAREHYRAGRLREAEVACRQVLEREPLRVETPRYVEALVNRSAAYLALGKFDRALQDAEGAVALDPDYAPAHLQRAEV